MQELKVQNELLLELINSKTRENQLLLQQNQRLHSPALRHLPIHSPRTQSRDSQAEEEIAKLKREVAMQGGLILMLKSQLAANNRSKQTGRQVEEAEQTSREEEERQKRRIAQLETKLREKGEELEELKKQMEEERVREERAKREEQENELEALMEVLEVLQQELRSSQEKILVLEAQREVSGWSFDKELPSLPNLRSLIDHLPPCPAADFLVSLTSLESDFLQLRETLSSLSLHHPHEQEMKADNDRLSADNAYLQEKCESLEQQLASCLPIGSKLGGDPKEQYIEMLTAVIESIKNEHEESISKIQKKNMLIRELERRLQETEDNYEAEITELRNSIAGGFAEDGMNYELLVERYGAESPREGQWQREKREMQTQMHQLQQHLQESRQEAAQLKGRNQQLEEELRLVKSREQGFERELNDILGESYQGFSKVEEDKVEKLTAEREEAKAKCAELEKQVEGLEKQVEQLEAVCSQLTAALERLADGMQQPPQQPPQQPRLIEEPSRSEKSVGEQPLRAEQRSMSKEMEISHSNLFLQSQARPTSHSTPPFEPTLHNIESGYNHEIMALRLNIAQLNSQLITLRRTLFQAKPDIDISKLFTDSVPHDYPTRYFRPVPLRSSQYSQSCLTKSILGKAGQAGQVGQGERGRAGWRERASRAQSANRAMQLNLGERITGRRCVWGDPFGEVPGPSIQQLIPSSLVRSQHH